MRRLSKRIHTVPTYILHREYGDDGNEFIGLRFILGGGSVVEQLRKSLLGFREPLIDSVANGI